MKCASIVLAVLACLAGLVAAWYWRESTKVQIDTGWGLPGSGMLIEPINDTQKSLAWAVATIQAFNKASELSRTAALWTAGTVFLSALSAIAGAISN
jgi:hypothetical protein